MAVRFWVIEKLEKTFMVKLSDESVDVLLVGANIPGKHREMLMFTGGLRYPCILKD
jgi:hypothetical protein